MNLETTTIYNKLKYSSYFYKDCFDELLSKPKNMFEFIHKIPFQSIEPDYTILQPDEDFTCFTDGECNTLQLINAQIKSGKFHYDSNDKPTKCLYYKLKTCINHHINIIIRDQVLNQEILGHAINRGWYIETTPSTTTNKYFINTSFLKLVLSYCDYCKRNAFNELLDFDENILSYFIESVPILGRDTELTGVEFTIVELKVIVKAHKHCQSGDYSDFCEPENEELRRIIEKCKGVLKKEIEEIEEERCSNDANDTTDTQNND